MKVNLNKFEIYKVIHRKKFKQIFEDFKKFKTTDLKICSNEIQGVLTEFTENLHKLNQKKDKIECNYGRNHTVNLVLGIF